MSNERHWTRVWNRLVRSKTYSERNGRTEVSAARPSNFASARAVRADREVAETNRTRLREKTARLARREGKEVGD